MASFTEPASSPPIAGHSPPRRSQFRSSPAKRYSPFQPRFNSVMKENDEGDEHYSDRFIPSRTGSRMEPGFSMSEESQYIDTRLNSSSGGGREGGNNETSGASSTKQPILNRLLRSELLGIDFDPRDDVLNEGNLSTNSMTSTTQSAKSRQPNLFRFKTPAETIQDNDPRSIYDLSPVKGASKRLLLNPQKEIRKICKVPFKVLDAPALQDDFYLNLVDWYALIPI